MKQRISSRPTFWGDERSPAERPWADVDTALRDAMVYWLNTVTGTGRPIPRPVWGTWHDDHLMLSVGSVTHWHNIVDGGREKVSVHLPSDTEVVILQGRATVVDNPSVLGPFCEAYNAKYQWIFEPTTTGPVVQVDPDKVIAWTTLPAEQGTPEMDFPDTAARWTFH